MFHEHLFSLSKLGYTAPLRSVPFCEDAEGSRSFLPLSDSHVRPEKKQALERIVQIHDLLCRVMMQFRSLSNSDATDLPSNPR